MSPFTNKDVNTVSLNNYQAEASYLTAINFVQKSKLPFLMGFILVDFGEGGHINSGSRSVTVDLNACYYLSTGAFPTSKIAVIDFYFSDLNTYKDLSWVDHYPDAIVYKDRDKTAYKVTDLKGLPIYDRTIIKIRLSFDLFLPFLGIFPFIREKKLLKLTGAQVVGAETVSYYGQVYRFDKYLDFTKNSFFMQGGDLYLCP